MLPRPRASAGALAAPLLWLSLSLSACSLSGDDTGDPAPAGPPVRVARVSLHPVPDAVVATCRSVQERAAILILCPRRLPRPVRDLAGSSALPPDALFAFPWDATGLDFSYSAEAGRPRLDRPERFMHLQVIEQDQRLPPGVRRARLGGKDGLLAPATSRSYSAESYFGNHVRFFWTERRTRYAATLHDFGPRTRRLLGWLIRDLRPAESLPRPQPDAEGVTTVAVPVPGPVSVDVDDREVWVAGQGNRSVAAAWLARLDPRTARPAGERIGIARGGTSAVLVDGAVWVGHRGPPGLQRLDREAGTLVRAGRAPPDVVALARTKGSLWMVLYEGQTLLRTDPATGRTQAAIATGRAPAAVAPGSGDVWVTNNLDGTVSRIDTRANRVAATIPVGREPVGVVASQGAVWVANNGDDTVSRIDPAANRVVETIPVGHRPRGLAAGHGRIWSTNNLDDTVSEIDPRTNEVVDTIRVGAGPTGVAAGAGAVWVVNTLDQTVSRLEP